MGKIGRRMLVACGGALLSGCGFHPVYEKQSAAGPQHELGAIDVDLIPERGGLLLREALQQRLDHGNGIAKHYTLNVSFSVVGDSVSEQTDSSITRLRESATAQWTLKARDPAQTLVTRGTARALDGVNVIDNQYFAADLEGETATKRISENIADQITLQLATFFARRAAAT
jgi:LPS-assembly lipoprotein